jgi:hypothetical protein
METRIAQCRYKLIVCEPLKEGFTIVYGVLPREQGAPGWSAQWRRIVAVENNAVVSQGVDIWRRNLIRSMETHVIPTLFER